MAKRKTSAQLDREIAQILQQSAALPRSALIRPTRRAGVEDEYPDPDERRRFRQLASMRKAERAKDRAARQRLAEMEYASRKDALRFEKLQRERGLAPIHARFPLREGTGSERPRRR